MERLPVFKALGDNTRYAIYLEVARSESARTTSEIADALDLHPNTVRPHLERMRDAGLLSVETSARGQVGREYGVALSAGTPRGSFSSCVAAVEARMAELGFDPALAEDGGVVTVAFTRCPFRELAEQFPEVVCPIHRGLVEGVAQAAAGGRVRRFATLADRDPCQADLVRA